MEALLFVLVLALAALLQGITGFGSALIAAPLLLLFVDKETAVVALAFASIALNSFLLWRVPGGVDREQLRTLIPASLVGLPLGLVLLIFLSIDALRVAAGTLSVIFAVFLYRKLYTAVRRRWIAGAGLLSGVLHTSIGMSGPPVVLLLAGKNTEKNSARKTFAIFFLVMSVVSMPVFLLGNVLTREGVLYGLAGIPGVLIGAYVGTLIARKVPQQAFRLLVLTLVFLTGAVTAYSGLAG